MENITKRFDWVVNYGTNNKPDYKYFRNQGSREQLEWIKRQLEYASFAERYKLRYDLKKGEIYEIDWGLNVNAEFSSRHYGVVLSDSGPFNPLVTICPLKTKHKDAHPRSDIDLGIIGELDSDKSTLAVINQIRTIDKLRIFTKRAIGKFGEVKTTMNEENNYCDDSIPRLESEKVDKIVNAYITMMILGDSDAWLYKELVYF